MLMASRFRSPPPPYIRIEKYLKESFFSGARELVSGFGSRNALLGMFDGVLARAQGAASLSVDAGLAPGVLPDGAAAPKIHEYARVFSFSADM